jgi:hypothetical protein
MEHCTKISRAWLIFQRPILCRQVKKSPDAPFSGAMASLRCCGRSVQRLRTALALHAEGRGGGLHRFLHPRSRHFWGNRSVAEERLAGGGDCARSRERRFAVADHALSCGGLVTTPAAAGGLSAHPSATRRANPVIPTKGIASAIA